MKRILLLVAVLTLSACGSVSHDDPLKNKSAQDLFKDGMELLSKNNYEQAIKQFEAVEARYPYGALAAQAQLETAYAWYKSEEPTSAIAAADRFIKLHPNDPHVDYAWYLKGLANFNDGSGLLSRMSGQDLSERDPKAAADSFAAFRELVTRYPNSKYTADARERMNYLINTLANHELHVARYYMRRQAYVAATGRAKYILETYPQTPATEEALAILVKGYDAMGLADLSRDSLRVLQKNFPKSRFLADASKPPKSAWKFW